MCRFFKSNVAAQTAIGECYQKGEGVGKDDVQAFRWFELASKQHDPGMS